MKKEYVSLSLKIVDVQLSDCIAGSNVISVGGGDHINNEIDASGLGTGDDSASFGTW